MFSRVIHDSALYVPVLCAKINTRKYISCVLFASRRSWGRHERMGRNEVNGSRDIPSGEGGKRNERLIILQVYIELSIFACSLHSSTTRVIPFAVSSPVPDTLLFMFWILILLSPCREPANVAQPVGMRLSKLHPRPSDSHSVPQVVPHCEK